MDAGKIDIYRLAYFRVEWRWCCNRWIRRGLPWLRAGLFTSSLTLTILLEGNDPNLSQPAMSLPYWYQPDCSAIEEDRYQDETSFIIITYQRRRGWRNGCQATYPAQEGEVKSWHDSLYRDTEKPYEQYHYHMYQKYQYHISYQWQYISNIWSSNIFSIIICYQLTTIRHTSIM